MRSLLILSFLLPPLVFWGQTPDRAHQFISPMAARTKSVIKQSEAELQMQVVKYIRATIPGVKKIIANPFSELQLPGSEQYRWKVLGNAKAKGWEKSQPDIICLNRFQNFAIEVKKEDEDPFRPFRGGGMWITHSQSKQVDHVLAQAKYMYDLRQCGTWSCFGAGFDQCKAAVDYFRDNLTYKLTGYNFKYASLTFGKYTPEEFEFPYLKKI